jgi:segregation and condensation protein A
MLDTSIQVNTESFDGPLALLLLLIQKEEMDVKKLDLTKITGQYLAYIAALEELNFDLAGDYLYLAATLVYLKSKTCLTEEDESQIRQLLGDSDLNISSRADLIGRLEELQKFQRLSEKLWKLPRHGEQIFTRPRIDRKAIINSILLPMEMDKLTLAMIDFIRRDQRKFTVVKRDRLSIKEKLERLKNILVTGASLTFDEIVGEEDRSIENIVISFISLLELARLKKIGIFQNDETSTIYIDVRESLQDFDVNAANGFEPESDALVPQVPAMAVETVNANQGPEQLH